MLVSSLGKFRLGFTYSKCVRDIAIEKFKMQKHHEIQMRAHIEKREEPREKIPPL
jgi:hypothetical protein